MAEAEHQRIAGGVLELVDPADLEAVLDEDVGRRRVLDIGDVAVAGVLRVDRVMGPADDPLIGAGIAEDLAVGEGAAPSDGEADCSGHLRFPSKRLDAVVS